jgi:DNA-binding CsgD family transcriptional regulator
MHEQKILSEYSDIFSTQLEFSSEYLEAHIEKLKELDRYIPHMSTFFCITNTVSRSFEYVSKNFTACTGLDIRQMCDEGMTFWWSRMHPDEMENWLKSLNDLMTFTLTTIPIEDRKKMTYTWNYRIIDGNQAYKNIIQHTTPMYLDEEGKPIIGLAHYSVISSHEHIPIQATAKILNSQNEYETLYHQVYGGQKLLSHDISFRERDILRLLSFGYNSEEIAKKLNISSNTVKTHRKNILQKSEARNTTELVALCIRQGLI